MATTIPTLAFTKNWENPDDFPTIQTDETQVRKDMQVLHDETKDFLNNKLAPYIDTADIDCGEW